jgi:CrcB protein
MIRLLLIIGVGGFLGSISRYLVQGWMIRLFASPFPIGTFLVNIIGSFLIGIIYAAAEKTGLLSTEWRFFLATGFCGGFTTFSTFSYEIVTMLRGGMTGYAMLYVLGSVVLGVLATLFGIWLIRIM